MKTTGVKLNRDFRDRCRFGYAQGRDLPLVTCYPFYVLGRAPRTFLVHAWAVA